MMSPGRFREALPSRTARRLTLPLLLALCVSLVGQPRGAAADPKPAPALGLPECLQLAHERQPRIAAQRASLAAAEDGQRALDALRFTAALIDHEIPVRRKQAALGVEAATAALDQTERETTYAVTRTWFTVLYAREQERVAQGVVARLTETHNAARRALESGARDATTADVDRSGVYLRLAETKRTQATQGVKRALVALREAIGLGPDAVLDVPAGRLPVPDARPDRDEVVKAALARRGEVIQANVFAQVACLEVEAQGTSIHQRVQTFAAGSDIHSRPVPQGVHDTEYRPGAVPPEMPTLLAGSRTERVKHAESLHDRAEAAAEVARNLVTLEAEDAFLRWEEAAEQVRQAREAADTGDKLADALSKDYAAGQKVKLEEVINAQVLASQARSQYNEYLYRQILALADLERVTAGALCAGLVPATAGK
jgi:outer membrane protein TolC